MVKVTKEAAEAHRRSLAEAAGRLFREKGLDGVGVAEIGRAAGLTHGAIYSGFGSKQDLALAALQAGRQASRSRRAQALGAEPQLAAILDDYLSDRQRDDRIRCCPMVASASEAARQDDGYRQAFAGIFLELAATLQGAIERRGAADARQKALAIAAGMVGVVAIARALDPQQSEDLLAASRTAFAAMAGP